MYQRPTEGESVALTQAAHAGTFITSAAVSSLSRPAAERQRGQLDGLRRGRRGKVAEPGDQAMEPLIYWEMYRFMVFAQ